MKEYIQYLIRLARTKKITIIEANELALSKEVAIDNKCDSTCPHLLETLDKLNSGTYHLMSVSKDCNKNCNVVKSIKCD